MMIPNPPDGDADHFIDLPTSHTYTLHGLFPTLSEDVCKGLVEKVHGNLYKNYSDSPHEFDFKLTAKASL